MFTPVVPSDSAVPPRVGAMRRGSSFKRLTIQTHDLGKPVNGTLAAVAEGGDGDGAALSPRRTSKRQLSIKPPSFGGTITEADPATAVGIGRRQSMKFFRRTSTRRSIAETKKETPPHLVKLLQKTPEQKALVDAVKLTLSEEPELRNESSLDLLYDWMLQNCKQYSNNIFGSAPEYIRREICRQMRLIKMLSNQMIIRQGDTGDRCYIVIDGLVDVYIKKKDALVSSSSSDGLTPTHAAAVLAKEYGDLVANLGPGAMFGEIVLLNPSARRNASILASQYSAVCDLICLERADYIRLVRGASMEASHYNQAEILDQMYLFQGWEKQDKMKIVSAMRSVHFTSNDYLYRAGADAKWMYIITSGEVVERVNWTVGKTTSNLSSLASGGAFTATTTPAPVASSSSTTSQRASNNRSEQPEKKVSIDLLLVGAGDVVGELPFVKSKQSALLDIKSLSDVHALALDRRTFETMILHAKSETHAACHATLLKLQKLSDEREDWRHQRLECGAAYPNAHISITWQLMRMSNLWCPRCGVRGHLASDTQKCALPGSPKRKATDPLSRRKAVKPSTSVQLPPLPQQHRKKMALIGSTGSSVAPRPRDSATRDLLDESYLPSAREQLALCRLDTERSRVTSYC